jgi:hypothetical protein
MVNILQLAILIFDMSFKCHLPSAIVLTIAQKVMFVINVYKRKKLKIVKLTEA